MVISSKCISQLDVECFPLARNWRFCLVAKALLSSEMFLHERLHGGITIFLAFHFYTKCLSYYLSIYGCSIEKVI